LTVRHYNQNAKVYKLIRIHATHCSAALEPQYESTGLCLGLKVEERKHLQEQHQNTVCQAPECFLSLLREPPYTTDKELSPVCSASMCIYSFLQLSDKGNKKHNKEQKLLTKQKSLQSPRQDK
jgi:hypothetical protein